MDHIGGQYLVAESQNKMPQRRSQYRGRTNQTSLLMNSSLQVLEPLEGNERCDNKNADEVNEQVASKIDLNARCSRVHPGFQVIDVNEFRFSEAKSQAKPNSH